MLRWPCIEGRESDGGEECDTACGRGVMVTQVSDLRSQLGPTQNYSPSTPPATGASLSRILASETPQAAVARVQQVSGSKSVSSVIR